VTVSLSVSPVNVTSLSTVDFPGDVRLQLHMPRACDNIFDIRIVLTILDFARSALIDLVY